MNRYLSIFNIDCFYIEYQYCKGKNNQSVGLDTDTSPEVFYKNGGYKGFTILKGKNLCLSHFLTKQLYLNFYKARNNQIWKDDRPACSDLSLHK